MLKQRRLLLLWLGIHAALLVLLQQAFAGWISALFAALLLLRLVGTLTEKNTLSLKQVNILALFIALALLANLQHAGVLHFMLQILLLAAMLRLLALKHLYEARQLVWVHYFLIGSCFILHQDMLVALVVLLVLLANMYSHYLLFCPAGLRINWRQTGRACLIILPLWLAMFVLFPRLPPFWQIPTANVASTGLSDTLDPGSIERLVQDDSLAFRVEFTSALPERSQLYWRSHLYEDFDGRRWSVNKLRKNAGFIRSAPPAATPGAATLQYRIIAEASQQRSLFALASPISSSANVMIVPSGLVSAVKPVSQRLSYQISSIASPVASVSEQEHRLNLQLPAGNARTVAFAQQLQQQYPDTTALIDAIAAHFRQQAYFYSLTPPPLGTDSIDQFLFSSRTGFCSHYASATAVMLRAAGIAARVVGGYQGGDWHTDQGYLAVRQREAHAWVEYLHNGQWYAFDPTAAVAPERILSSLDAALSPEQRRLLTPAWRNVAVLQALRQQLMHLDYYWSVWVLGFDDNHQRELWQNLKKQLLQYGYLLLILIIVVLLAGVFFLYPRLTKPTGHAASLMLQRAFAALLRDKPAQQPLSVYLLQYARQYPEHHVWLHPLVQCYEQAIFNNNALAFSHLKRQLKHHRNELKRLQRAVKNAQSRL